uniref:Uncharacterized protein n=1 Tax=Anguilla anguilla TaxID=7936 RepID=A0A0E9TUF9_ANGAN
MCVPSRWNLRKNSSECSLPHSASIPSVSCCKNPELYYQ